MFCGDFFHLKRFVFYYSSFIFDYFCSMNVYSQILTNVAQGKKMLCFLIDPDKNTVESFRQLLFVIKDSTLDFIFVGGSLLSQNIDETIRLIKQETTIPVVIFPGSMHQVSAYADALLYLSLISGRNAEYLIGQQVQSAPLIKKMGIETISVGYMLIDGGKPTSVEYISNTLPIPHDKEDIAVATALAAELIGMKMLYLEAGSGAENPVSERMISQVKKHCSVPVIVGGGIRSVEAMQAAFSAGADLVVIGNHFETHPSDILKFVQGK